MYGTFAITSQTSTNLFRVEGTVNLSQHVQITLYIPDSYGSEMKMTINTLEIDTLVSPSLRKQDIGTEQVPVYVVLYLFRNTL